MDSFSLEVTVIMYGIFHGIGGASVAINLGMMAYIGDITTHETKVSPIMLSQIILQTVSCNEDQTLQLTKPK
jgi:hypothetical protein